MKRGRVYQPSKVLRGVLMTRTVLSSCPSTQPDLSRLLLYQASRKSRRAGRCARARDPPLLPHWVVLATVLQRSTKGQGSKTPSSQLQASSTPSARSLALWQKIHRILDSIHIDTFIPFIQKGVAISHALSRTTHFPSLSHRKTHPEAKSDPPPSHMTLA